jgi:hypothetical protein
MTEQRRTDFHAGPRRLPWAIGGVAALVYLLTMQRQLFNDGIFFEHMMRLGGHDLVYSHILYLPLAKSLQLVISLAVPIEGEQALRILSALAGGAGVGLTFVVARDCLESVRRGLVCAVLLATLAAYWFHSTATELHSVHAACTTLLLVGLFRALDRRHHGSSSSCVFLLAGAALTPASHLGGVCVGLPLMYVWLRAGAARKRYTISVGTGLLVFAVAYGVISYGVPGFADYQDVHTGKHQVLWEDPGKVPHLLKICLAELFLYSAPAAALVPAGLRVLFRLAPVQAWFCVCWLIAWPLVAWPVEDRMFGAYYTPTYPVQALLAVVAMHGAGFTVGRAWCIAFLGILPLFVFVFSSVVEADQELIGLSVLAFSATLIFFLAGGRTGQPRVPWLLPTLAFLTTAPHMINVGLQDRYRDRIADVAAIVERAEKETGERALLIFLAANTNSNHHWKHFFPGAYGDESRAFNPVELAFPVVTKESASARLERYGTILRDALANGRPVFLEGRRDPALLTAAGHDSIGPVVEFFAKLESLSILGSGGLPDLWRLEPRR